MFGCEDNDDGDGDEVRTVKTGVLEKMYTEKNGHGVTVHYDDDETSSLTVVIFASYLNTNDIWVNVENVGSYFSSTIYVVGDSLSYDDKKGYAAFIRDTDKDLLGKELKLWYIP